MNRNNIGTRWILMLAVGLSTASFAADKAKDMKDDAKMAAAKGEAAKVDAPKPDKAAVKESMNAVQKAIAELQKEHAAHVADPQGIKLRDKCDYFLEDKSAILLETVFQALQSTISPDVAADSYIKWQLLSAAPAKFSGDQVRTVAIIYYSLNKPHLRPGMAAADKAQLDPLAKGVKTAEDAKQLAEKLQGLVDKWEDKNKPVLAYREELNSRLPIGAESLVARLEDVRQRIVAGYPGEHLVAVTAKAIEKWSGSDGLSVQDLTLVTEQVRKFVIAAGGKPAEEAAKNDPTAKTAPTANSKYKNNPYAGFAGYGMGKYSKYNNQGMSARADTGSYFPPKFYNILEIDAKGVKFSWKDDQHRYRSEKLGDLLTNLDDTVHTAAAAATEAASKPKETMKK